MARQMIQSGTLDIPTPDEVGAVVDGKIRSWWDEQAAIAEIRERERLRGKKRIELFLPLAGTSTHAFIGQNIGPLWAGNGPEQGFVWSLKLVAITLAGTGTLGVYKASSDGDKRRPLFYTGTGQPVQVATWGSDAARIRFGEGIYVEGSTNLNSVYLAAWEVPAEREGEVYD